MLYLIPFEDEADAIRIANDTPYGLAAYVSGEDAEAERVARRIRASMVTINDGDRGFDCPIGEYKQSGNGREGGEYGFADYLEIKIIA